MDILSLFFQNNLYIYIQYTHPGQLFHHKSWRISWVIGLEPGTFIF